MGYPWVAHGLPMRQHRKPVSDPCATHGRPMVFPWAKTVNPWHIHGSANNTNGTSIGEPWATDEWVAHR